MATNNPIASLHGTTATIMEKLDAEADHALFKGDLWSDDNIVRVNGYSFVLPNDDTDTIRPYTAAIDTITLYEPDTWNMSLELRDDDGEPYSRESDRELLRCPVMGHVDDEGYYDIFISAAHQHVIFPSGGGLYLPERHDLQHLMGLIDEGIAEPLSAIKCSALAKAITDLTIDQVKPL